MKGTLLAAILCGAGLGFSQISSTVSLSNGVQLSVTASLGQPTGQETLKVELAAATGDSFYRIFRDQNNVSFFAYELEVHRSGNTQIQLTVKPAGDDFAARFPNADGGKPTPTIAEDRDLPLLRTGERAHVDLFQIPGMGLQVSDSILVKLDPAGEVSSASMQFTALQVFLNRTLISAPGSSVSGRYAMFYIPGHGGYFFSAEAVPNRPFLAAGTIDHNRMKFNVEGDTFDCTSASSILRDSPGGNVWVYHDPAYKPEGNWTKGPDDIGDMFFSAAADSLNWWLH